MKRKNMKTETKKTIGYIRVSSLQQVEDKESLERQDQVQRHDGHEDREAQRLPAGRRQLLQRPSDKAEHEFRQPHGL